MARPTKEGLDYFSLDTDIFNDDKVKLIKAKHGLAGFAIVVLLLTKIYHNGYFYRWSEDELYLFSDEVRTDINTVSTIVNDCINKGLFSKKLYDEYKILTSHGVQKRFLKATTKRKKIMLIREYFIADDYIQTIKLDNVAFIAVSSVFNPANGELKVEEIPQSKVKESKEKVKESKDDDNARETKPVDNVPETDFTLFRELSNAYGILSSVEMSCLTEWREFFAADILTECFKRYKENGGMGRKYMDAVFINWQKAGVKTFDDVQSQDEIFEKAKHKEYTPRGKPDDPLDMIANLTGGIRNVGS